ncbi:ABC transporter substrate-binding protein [Pseudoroseomonas wenyumeiae]|uniref:ABC transporter substrate-binding protein n=1 Tax=Teichococcus wenyumeiae TaxID=2478470 RepID=A0A3A9J8T5_9PROT|nr:ABC transporter substrate-binding protein [Pseudoroseomonas wenyumeiae]RKK03697.1 ABC transporter substrate-binding protein [Pseudoroseomonas wenyumeiae]RMI19431.1 ABC transporter substrate-binding protein [Pseudoroseomonas wenyumeiae]
MRLPALLLAGLLASTALTSARAQPREEARVGLQTETSSIDPHFALVGANQTVAQHLFDPMLGSDRNLRPVPGLTSFTNPEPDLWEFRVREGARFQDGTPVTARDILFSLQRMPKVPNSPAPFIRMAGAVVEMQVVDDSTIRLRSRGPDPSVILNAMTAYVVPEHVAKDATTADFNAGRAAIGSGPWRFREWQPGSRIALERNDDYWGEKPAFARASLRPVANDAARLAALLAGDLDLIDAVPPGEIVRLRGNKAVGISSASSSRMIYLALDQSGDSTPFVTGKDGKPLPQNPLRDARVRRALSMGINRQAIVERVLSGASRPAGQLAVEGQIGYAPDLAAPAFDAEAAKRLLAEAGYPDGFRITLHSPNNRYIEDDKTSQAVAQFWTRIGIETRVEVMPSNVFFTRAGKREFSAFLIGFGHTTGDSWLGLSQVLHSFDQAKGLGGLNRGRYSSPRFDRMIDEARTVADLDQRGALLRQAQEVAFREEAGIIPLHVPNNTWAHRAGLSYEAGLDENTLTQHLRLAP